MKRLASMALAFAGAYFAVMFMLGFGPLRAIEAIGFTTVLSFSVMIAGVGLWSLGLEIWRRCRRELKGRKP